MKARLVIANWFLLFCGSLLLGNAQEIDSQPSEWRFTRRNVALNEVACILTTRDPVDNRLSYTNSMWIDDGPFVRSLYKDLLDATPKKVIYLTFCLPRPIIFLDSKKDVICAYTCDTVASPDIAFRPSEIRENGKVFELQPHPSFSATMRQGLIIRGFANRAKPFMKLYPDLSDRKLTNKIVKPGGASK